MSAAPLSVPQVARFFLVRRLGEVARDAIPSLLDARDEAQRLAKEQGGQYGVFELMDAYQSGHPPITQVIIKR